MPRLLRDSEYLYGLHDPGGEHIMLGQDVPGWVLITVAVGHDPNDHSPGDDRSFWSDYRRLSDKRLGVMVRLNNGYGGAGTLPYQQYYDNFARRCANFVRNSQGAHIWIVGNETNHPIEWPGADWDWDAAPPRPRSPDREGEKITPDRYANCYRQVREAIHALSGHEKDQVLIGAVAPWNNLTTYDGNPHGDWVQYFRDLLERLGPQSCDGITLHAYTHGTDPKFIQSPEKVRDQRFQQYHWHFRAYQDFMQAIPTNMRHLPVYITETDQGDDPWRNENAGWVRQAYQEIAEWNRKHEQQIRSLILYRWPKVGSDKWYIDGKAGVIEDFKQALTERHGPGEGPDIDVEALRKQVDELSAQVNELQPALRRIAALPPEVTRLQQMMEGLAGQAEQVAALRQPVGDLLAKVEQLEADVGITPGGVVPQPLLQDVRTTLPVHASQRWPSRSADTIQRVVVHHTVTRDDVTPQRIAEAHVGQDKPGIKYHFLLTGDGAIYWTQPLEAVVEQTRVSAVNDDGVAVALAGNFTEAVPTAAQMDSAARLIVWLLSTLQLSSEAVWGRNELDRGISSPGAQWLGGARFKDTLLAQVRSILDEAEDPAQVIAQLRQQVRDLQTQIAGLQALAAQVSPLQQEVQGLQATVQQQKAEIARLQDIIDAGCGGGGVVRQPDVLDVVDSLPQHPTLRYAQRTRPISMIVAHHTDTPPTFTVEQLAHYHAFGTRKDAQGNWIKKEWPGIGYHFVITPDGTIYQGQREETCSYHVGGEPNNYSLGVSFIGRFMRANYDDTPRTPEEQVPTPQQMRSASRLIAWLMQKHDVPIEKVMGHRDVWPGHTVCPGDQWTAGAHWKSLLHQQINAVLQGREKLIDHCLLFWDHGADWGETDWRNAQAYIAHFRPTSGFSTDDALLAQHVTIVGGDAGVSGEDEARLRAAGVDVHRLAGADEAETRALLGELVEKNTPWPGAPPLVRKVTEPVVRDLAAEVTAATAVDEWSVPDEWSEVEVSPAVPESARPRVKVSPLE